jgi:hypothetical protein
MNLILSSPCPKRWTDLVGNDRIRYCGDCKLNVYNLAIMRPAEIEALFRKTGGRLCGQLYVRNDRTATLRDCPPGRSGVLRRRIAKAAAAFLALAVGLAFRGMDRPETSGLPPWMQAVANWIEPEKPLPPAGPRPMMLGGIRCVPSTPPPPPVQPPPPATLDDEG